MTPPLCALALMVLHLPTRLCSVVQQHRQHTTASCDAAATTLSKIAALTDNGASQLQTRQTRDPVTIVSMNEVYNKTNAVKIDRLEEQVTISTEKSVHRFSLDLLSGSQAWVWIFIISIPAIVVACLLMFYEFEEQDTTHHFHGRLVPGFHGGEEASRTMQQQDWRLIRLGIQEIRTRAVYGAMLTECNFTAIFMYIHIGIVRAATKSGFPVPAVVGALGHFVLIALLTFAGAASSGAHMNPNITLATVLTGHTTAYRGFLYIIAQLVGAILGVLAMKATLGWDGVTTNDLTPCGFGKLTKPGTFMAEFMLFHSLLCIIGGIAFDPQQEKVFGAVLAPLFIAGGVALLIFAASGEGYGPGLNWAQCYGTSVVTGEFNGSEWYSFCGPSCAAIFHSIIFVMVPPSHSSGGRFVSPLVRGALGK